MSGRYARVYHDLMDDPKFATVYENDHRFALWVRLLLAADAAWPSPPPSRGTLTGEFSGI